MAEVVPLSRVEQRRLIEQLVNDIRRLTGDKEFEQLKEKALTAAAKLKSLSSNSTEYGLYHLTILLVTSKLMKLDHPTVHESESIDRGGHDRGRSTPPR